RLGPGLVRRHPDGHGGPGAIHAAAGRQSHGFLPHCPGSHRKHAALGDLVTGGCVCRSDVAHRLPRAGPLVAPNAWFLKALPLRGDTMKIRTLLGASTCPIAALAVAPTAIAAHDKPEYKRSNLMNTT